MARRSEKKSLKNHQIFEFGFPYVAQTMEGWLNILVFIFGVFCHLLHIFWKKFTIFENIERIRQIFCLCLLEAQQANPLFSDEMCRLCIVKQWPSASNLWRLKTWLITHKKIQVQATEHPYTWESFKSSYYKVHVPWL
jgi:hypothetical protein